MERRASLEAEISSLQEQTAEQQAKAEEEVLRVGFANAMAHCRFAQNDFDAVQERFGAGLFAGARL
eukprot:4532204-Lingulodinium_polyedra.AAC.1